MKSASEKSKPFIKSDIVKPCIINLLINNDNNERNIPVRAELSVITEDELALEVKVTISVDQIDFYGRLDAKHDSNDNYCDFDVTTQRFHSDTPYQMRKVRYKGLGSVLVYLCYEIAIELFESVSLKCDGLHDALPFYQKIGMTVDKEYYQTQENKKALENAKIDFNRVCQGEKPRHTYESVRMKLYPPDVLSLQNRAKQFLDDVDIPALLSDLKEKYLASTSSPRI